MWQLHHWVALMDEGTSKGMVPLRLPQRESVATICFTSGTTGVPKGAILTHGAFAATISAAMRGPMTQQGLVVDNDDSYMSYLPLAHVFERILTDLIFVNVRSPEISNDLIPMPGWENRYLFGGGKDPAG